MSDEPKPDMIGKGDIIRIHAKGTDGSYLASRATPEGIVSMGKVAPVEEGKPIPPDMQVVCYENLGGNKYKVTDVYSGPARYNSHAYRTGWDAVFGKGQAN